MRDLGVLVVQQVPDVSRRIGEELALAGASVRVAGPVDDLERAVARAQGQVVDVVLLDLYLAGSRGAATYGLFASAHPGVAVVVTAPRRFEAEARKAVVAGARQYLLREEIGRGLLVPLLRHVAGAQDEGDPAAASSRRLLHDLGNVLAVVSGECEMLLGRMAEGGPFVEDMRQIQHAASEGVALFRKLVAARRAEASDAGTSGR
jgi:DNA-binding NarL/FixJ family response regulator